MAIVVGAAVSVEIVAVVVATTPDIVVIDHQFSCSLVLTEAIQNDTVLH